MSMISSRQLVLRRLRLSRRNRFSVNFYTDRDAVSSWMTRYSETVRRPLELPISPVNWPYAECRIMPRKSRWIALRQTITTL
jgi:hypothetical protein